MLSVFLNQSINQARAAANRNVRSLRGDVARLLHCIVLYCIVLYKAEMVSEKELRQAAAEAERSRAALHTVEGLALVMLCSSKPIIRKQAVIMLKEARNLFTVLNVPKVRPSSHSSQVKSSLIINFAAKMAE